MLKREEKKVKTTDTVNVFTVSVSLILAIIKDLWAFSSQVVGLRSFFSTDVWRQEKKVNIHFLLNQVYAVILQITPGA